VRRDTPKTRAFLDRGRESSAKSLSRSRFPRRPKPPTQLDQRDVELRGRFAAEKHRQGRCANCGYDGVFLEVHHVLRAELLKRLLGQKGQPCPPEIVWSPDNALVLCAEPAPNRCHNRHTLAFRRIPQSALRPENWRFACELDLEWVLRTEYPS
jgi:hypothetical protein